MFAVSPLEGLVSPDYSVFEAIEPCEVKHFEHLFKTPGAVDQFVQASKGIGSGFNRLYTPDFGAVPIVVPPLMHPLILQHQITPKTSRYTRCSMSMLPNVSINGRIRSSGQLGRWWYSISPCRNSECVRRFTVFAFNQRS